MIVEQSPEVILLIGQAQISHSVHVYYMIEPFDKFCSVSCVLYGILDTQNIYLSLSDLLGPLKLTIESDISFPTCTSILTMCVEDSSQLTA